MNKLVDKEDYEEELVNILSYLKTQQPNLVKKLSAPFIPNIKETSRVAIIGQETRGWLSSLDSHLSINRSAKELIKLSAEKYESIQSLNKQGRSKFGWLTIYTRKILGEQPLWLNFYGFDYKRGAIKHIKNKEIIDAIANYSLKKLVKEIKIANAKVLIFAGQYDGNFPALKRELQIINTEVIESGKYPVEKWDDLFILRIPHPAARNIKNKNQIIKAKINLAKSL
ncbi:hypothetical protein [Thorsellia kenyensis]|uniref:Uracil-DNA glycosylase-like domain-containing protein n=1 Tax=Thorsellia kenyensis TaxID=1549888 RepID=A0ABV6CB01_9GAMM